MKEQLIAQLRFLARAREAYLDGLKIETITDYFAASIDDRAVWEQVQAVLQVADILEGDTEAAQGWLPVEFWNEWAEKQDVQ